jgi:hypothetical protein
MNPEKTRFNLRKYENLHIVLWLIKDTFWVLDLKIPGLIMVFPTIFVAIDITRRSFANRADFMHNLAVVCWICANAIWMIGEFYFDDRLRSVAIVFFSLGLTVVAIHYIFRIKRGQ